MFINPHNHKYSHDGSECDSHGKAIPDEASIVRVEMIVRRSESNCRHTEKKACPSQLLSSQTESEVIVRVEAEDETDEADYEEREVGDDVESIRDPEERALIGEIVISLRLRDGGSDDHENDEDYDRCSP